MSQTSIWRTKLLCPSGARRRRCYKTYKHLKCRITCTSTIPLGILVSIKTRSAPLPMQKSQSLFDGRTLNQTANHSSQMTGIPFTSVGENSWSAIMALTRNWGAKLHTRRKWT